MIVGYTLVISGFFGELNSLSSTDKAVMIIGAVIMIHVALAIHELGHLLTGLVLGFRFEMFVVGLLGIKRNGDKIELYFNKNLSHYGGLAATTPVVDSEKNATKFARILIAGPISSILSSIVLIGISLISPPLIKFSFFIGGIASLGIFLATTIPSKTGIFFTDRKRYQRLMKAGHDQDVELAILHIMCAFAKDDSYKNIDYKRILILANDVEPFIKFFGLFNAICYQIEINKFVVEEVLNDYKIASKFISKNIVAVFDLEIDKHKKKYNTEPNKSYT
jgi:hypothetical protein